MGQSIWVTPLLAALSLAGCIGCTPLMEMRDCTDCPSEGIVEWDSELGAAWPEVDALLRAGGHGHIDWHGPQEPFWESVGVDGEPPEVFVRLDGEILRIRILRC